MDFSSFNFETSLQEGLDAMGFEKPTPIQEKAIPEILAGKDLIACAQTGTGKTAAFILPILNKINKSGSQNLNTLILAPTRELAIQIDQQIQGFAYFLGISSIPIYGGGDGVVWEQQKRALETGAEIVVATPGRLIALLAGGKIKLDSLEHLILDEADRMMDMGFSDDILTIVNYLPKQRQTVMFSATMPPKIRQFSMKLLNKPEEISIAIGKTAEGVTQSMYSVYDTQKEELVRHILSQKAYEAVIIFASTKEKVKSLYKVLRKQFEIEAFHSDLEQIDREKIMSAFKNKSVKILIGTDIISRGIDVVGIELVINYDTPGDPEDYVHRVGRTARADKEGTAITFVNPKDQYKFDRIESLIGMQVEQMPLPDGFEAGPDYTRGAKSSKKSTGPSNKGGFNKKKQSPNKPRKGNLPPRRNSVDPQKDTQKQSKSPEQAQKAAKPAPKKESSPESPVTSKYGKRRNVIDPD
ncbi:DEAD/DEAH box helicase [Algoriphagus halophytocola]|uniref:DEAD/DEAH box helicase n=1 Tax=Algoriphagus halophytocola TaxID=2991499 RepID=A0ABY6MLR4_9BACT|nr:MULTISPECIES: DEAD/DEAH box helicase [unclassified Algoriphagus]UZD23139.1 DEAD/DEAH box helicase [Algoriphagus sp. TR-M5]WBL44431.1 DEAD/DEAH box helicase [Algoriphagus sp. TR-M9]